MRVRFTAMITCMVLLTCLLTACGDSSTSNESDGVLDPVNQASEGNGNFNVTGYPIVNEPVKMRMMAIINPAANSEFEDNLFFQTMEEMTNVQWIFETYEAAAFEEKKNLLIASKSYPDVFFKAGINRADEYNFGKQGILLDHLPLAEQYAPNLMAYLDSHPEFRNAVVTPEGNLYTLPSIDKDTIIGFNIYNKTWAEKEGISKAPTDVDALEEMLIAFRDGDPNNNGQQDEIPYFLNGEWHFRSSFLSFFGIYPGDYQLMVWDDKTMYVPTTDEYRQALITARRWFTERLIDNDMFVNENMQTVKGSEGILGMFYDWHSTGTVPEEMAKDYDILPVLKAANGRTTWSSRNPAASGAFAITSACEYPEVAMRWVDYMYSEEGSILADYGIEGISYQFNDKNEWEWVIPEGEELITMRAKNTIRPGKGCPGIVWNLGPTTDWITNEVNEWEQANAYAGFIPTPKLFYSDEDTKAINTINADLDAYRKEMTAKFITGEVEIDAEWENYIATSKQIGCDKLVSIYQKNYDAMYK